MENKIDEHELERKVLEEERKLNYSSNESLQMNKLLTKYKLMTIYMHQLHSLLIALAIHMSVTTEITYNRKVTN